MLHIDIAHISEIGRKTKKEIVDGKTPSKCTLLELLMQLPFTELMCGEDHIGKEDYWRLGELVSGEGNTSAVRNSSHKSWREICKTSHKSWREIHKIRIAVLTPQRTKKE
jgi:hypothetical protein